MCARSWPRPTYLSLDELRADPNLARLLPPEVAYRCHALPVAEQGGQITVVMADPEDGESVSAIAKVLGREPCVVQGDAKTIDALLARVWGLPPDTHLKLLVCRPAGPAAEALAAYARSLGQLLSAAVTEVGCESGLEALAGEHGERPSDLLLVGEPDSALAGTWLSARAGRREIPPALLVASRPRWPLAHILLIVSGEAAGAAAADWVLRFARPGTSTVHILAVVPPRTAWQEQRRAGSPGHARDPEGLSVLLSAKTTLGHELQEVARRLEEQEIRGSLRMRQGPAEWQIRRELADGEYDLVVMGSELDEDGQSGADDLAAALLHWSDRPTLIAKPVST